MMKILFTSVGRRVELIQAFHEAARRINIDLTLIGADISNTAPAMAFCDETVIVPRISSPEYIPFLIDFCSRKKIDALIPTIDTDLMLLAQHKTDFGSTKVVISGAEKVAICRDKRFTAAYFNSVGLKSPVPTDNIDMYNSGFPAFIKPKEGSSSVFAYKVNNESELREFASRVPDYIIQPFISGTEYSVDVFCDFEGKPILITPRIRLAVRSGEVLKTQISMDKKIIDEIKILLSDFKPCGQITVQLIREAATGEDYYIEINPRFGGGAPLSMKAGADSAEMLLRLLKGEKLQYEEDSAEDGVVYSRFDQSICVSKKDYRKPVKGVIFDLDDTLYSEKQYVRSGYRKIADFLGRENASEKLYSFFEDGKLAIDEYLTEIGKYELKEECLKIYREQIPEITLYDGVMELIKNLKEKNIKVGIITDGRPDGQRNKLKALGLDKEIDDIIITDELGGTQFRKPCDIAFRIMQNRWKLPYEQIVYVGDNPQKDFQACRQLGIRWIYVKNEDGMYHDKNIAGENSLISVRESILKT